MEMEMLAVMVYDIKNNKRIKMINGNRIEEKQNQCLIKSMLSYNFSPGQTLYSLSIRSACMQAH
jgi:hypothetical protein